MTTPLIRTIAAALNSALPAAGVTESATLTKYTQGTRTAGNLAGGTNPTSTAYVCKGFVSTKKHTTIGGTLVKAGDVIVCLIALGDTEPGNGDTIAIDSDTHRVIDAEGTPALWTCLCRG